MYGLQALVEVKLLAHIRDKDPTDASNVIHLKDSFYFRHHLCVSFPIMSINLYEFIKSNNFRGISIGLIRRFAIQVL
jgi:dual specificity tyrosine-phosphorylation-regulated kinase 2/3/4